MSTHSHFSPNLNPNYANQYTQYPYGASTAAAASTSNASISSQASKSSRFDTIKSVFKRGPPPVPEKDPPSLRHAQSNLSLYPQAHQQRYAGSNVSLTPSDASGSTNASGYAGSQAPSALGHSSSKRGFFGFGKKSSKHQKGSSSHASQGSSESISRPRNVKHELHVDDGFHGLPAAWQASLSQLGYTPEELEVILAKQRQQPTTTAIPLLQIGQVPPSIVQSTISHALPQGQGPTPPAPPVRTPSPAYVLPPISVPSTSAYQQPNQRPVPTSPPPSYGPPVTIPVQQPGGYKPRQDSLRHQKDSKPPSPASQHSSQHSFSASRRAPQPPQPIQPIQPSQPIQHQPPVSYEPPVARVVKPPPRTTSTDTSVTPQRPRPQLTLVNPDPVSPPPTKIVATNRQDSDEDQEYDEPSTARLSPPVPRTPHSPPRLSLNTPARESVDWSESLFSAIPSATSFDNFRSSVVPPKSKSQALNPSSSQPSPISPATSIPPHIKSASAPDRSSTGSLGFDEPVIVQKATTMRIARAPSMRRTAPIPSMYRMNSPPVPSPSPSPSTMYRRPDFVGSQSSLRNDGVISSPSPTANTVTTGSSLPVTPQQGQDLAYSQTNGKKKDTAEFDSDSDEDDEDLRYTVRFDDAKADQIYAAMQQKMKARPTSQSTAKASKRESRYSFTGSPADGQEVDEEDEDGDILGSYLDDDQEERDDDSGSDYEEDEEDSPLDSRPPLERLRAAQQHHHHQQQAPPSIITNGLDRHQDQSSQSQYLQANYNNSPSPTSGLSAGVDTLMAPFRINGDSDKLSPSPGYGSAFPDSPLLKSPGFAQTTAASATKKTPPLKIVTNGKTRRDEVDSMVPLRRDVPEYLNFFLPFMQSGDPRVVFSDVKEIAEGESGSVYSARQIVPDSGSAARSPNKNTPVAIKKIAVAPGIPKIAALAHEMSVLTGIRHENVLIYEAFYFALDSLWIRMELMDRSLADLLGLIEEGLVLEERCVGGFARDTAQGLAFLAEHGIAHRDVRSDNLLITREGCVKLVDFSNAVRVEPDDRVRSDNVGVIYWQAPEVRKGAYDVLKVDVWSLGATVWELIEGATPFENYPSAPGDELPELTDAESFSNDLHDFLEMCQQPAGRRPSAKTLLTTRFIQSGWTRPQVYQLLERARVLESQLMSG